MALGGIWILGGIGSLGDIALDPRAIAGQVNNVSEDFFLCSFKVEKILKGILNSILSPSTSVKNQLMGEKICLR